MLHVSTHHRVIIRLILKELLVPCDLYIVVCLSLALGIPFALLSMNEKLINFLFPYTRTRLWVVVVVVVSPYFTAGLGGGLEGGVLLTG